MSDFNAPTPAPATHSTSGAPVSASWRRLLWLALAAALLLGLAACFPVDGVGEECTDASNCAFTCVDGSCSPVCRDTSVCDLSCSGGNCTFTCTDSSDCAAVCEGGGCTFNCQVDAVCNFDCPGGSCTFICDDPANCTGTCTGDNCSGNGF